jgi:hypothetical protein
MSKKQVAVTAVAAIGAAALIAILAIKLGGGRPIIIKGKTPAGPYVSVYPVSQKNLSHHSVFGEYTSIKLTAASGQCMVYNFGLIDGFKIHMKIATLITPPSEHEVYLDDQSWLPFVSVDFDENHFNYDSAREMFTSKEPLMITALSVDADSALCTDAKNQPIPTGCPTSFPNPYLPTFDDLTVQVNKGDSCP